MSHGPDLEHLAAQWAESPGSLVFAALADGLRKRGANVEALAVVDAGLARHPEHVPGLIVAARIHRDAGRASDADESLRAALRVDPSHPVVLESLADLAESAGNVAASRAWREALDAALPGDDGDDELSEMGDELDEADGDELLLSESLAALYERQGHTDRAHQLYVALAERDPGNAALAARRDSLASELGSRRPLPYDARLSGGTSLGTWLAAVASADAGPPAQRAGYDAFFEPDTAPVNETADIEAFQSWLKGLPR